MCSIPPSAAAAPAPAIVWSSPVPDPTGFQLIDIVQREPEVALTRADVIAQKERRYFRKLATDNPPLHAAPQLGSSIRRLQALGEQLTHLHNPCFIAGRTLSDFIQQHSGDSAVGTHTALGEALIDAMPDETRAQFGFAFMAYQTMLSHATDPATAAEAVTMETLMNVRVADILTTVTRPGT